MDEQPFFEINLTDFKEEEIEKLKKFHKSCFNLENIRSTASELKYISELKNLIHNEHTVRTQMGHSLNKPQKSNLWMQQSQRSWDY